MKNSMDIKIVFLSNVHKQLVEQFGGHGYPRTILIKPHLPPDLQHHFNQDKTTKQQEQENNGQDVKIPVDEMLDRRTELVD